MYFILSIAIPIELAQIQFTGKIGMCLRNQKLVVPYLPQVETNIVDLCAIQWTRSKLILNLFTTSSTFTIIWLCKTHLSINLKKRLNIWKENSNEARFYFRDDCRRDCKHTHTLMDHPVGFQEFELKICSARESSMANFKNTLNTNSRRYTYGKPQPIEFRARHTNFLIAAFSWISQVIRTIMPHFYILLLLHSSFALNGKIE